MTDARIVRTRAALHSSILELASHKPVHEISVSELAAHSEINRVTFYKHFGSPSEALAAALSSEIADASKEASHHPKGVDAFTWHIHIVITHMEAQRELYEIALRDPMDGTIPMTLSQNLTAVAESYLTKRRKKKPAIPDVDSDVAAAYIAGGSMTAIWAWFLEDDVPRERLFENLDRLLPEWFYSECQER